MSSVHNPKRCSIVDGKTSSPPCNTSRESKGIVENAVGESSLQREFQDLCVSRRLVRSVSQKFKKRSFKEGGGEVKIERGISSKCLSFHGRGGGCKVGVDTSEEYEDGCGRRKSNVVEDGKRYQPICGSEEARVDCFSYGAAERIWKRNCRKDKAVEEPLHSNLMEFFLPDDILEMCLVRLPMTNLMTSRLVCKKWRSLTSTSRFMQMRREHQKPWIFLFGVVKDGYCSGHIHVLDTSLDQWHKINANMLKGRFLFSVTTVGNEVYVVGGCSSLINFGKVDKSSCRTHKGVLVFNPITRSWRKVAPMKLARSSPILGVFEVNPGSAIFRSQKDRHERFFTRTRVGGVSDVYEDPHRLSLRRQHEDTFIENEASIEHTRHLSTFVKTENNFSNTKGGRRFALIVVGGVGSWDEPLDSGEIYDPVSNKWIEIGRLPGDFGVVCSGAVCKGLFYVYSETDKLAAYDLERCMWFTIQTTQSPSRIHEYYPKLISCNFRLFMLSVSWCEQNSHSSRRDTAVRKLWELDLMHQTWSEVSRHPDAPMDWNAAFVEDRGQIFAIEMFKIFGQVLDFLTVCDTSNLRLEWNRVSRKHVAPELDASSCITKSLAVLHM
ncbi:F-box/kelch-repeat protein [Thalictrum thalictroides]|uniref:F-box/kelch-repeat protein n=1 Tax=Thalictrum thalictroides TaxID=46969 RepID=A0A7J6XF42_THATH|nr:F-box/kelch-repeat protein [Thalictrum thalictroides]